MTKVYRFPSLWIGCLALSLSGGLRADQYHYSNLLVGDRAIGMGGAYTAVADDSSAVFYNPAGLAFALSNDISGSANALYTRKATYKDTIQGSDFVEKSGGTLPSFFGGLQKLDRISKGLVFAFGVYTLDSELKDQDDLITNVNFSRPANCIAYESDGTTPKKNADGTIQTGVDRPPTILDRFHRAVNQRGSTFYVGAGVGWRPMNNLAVGFAVNYNAIDELVQDYQDVRTSSSKCTEGGNFSDRVETKSQNIRQHLTASGIQPVFSLQYTIDGRISLGLTVKAGTYYKQSYDHLFESHTVNLAKADQAKVDATTGEVLSDGKSINAQSISIGKSSSPLGKMPIETRMGAAWFYSTRLLMSTDVTHYTKVSNADNIAGVGQLYSREAVTNFAVGLEYYLVPSIPLRLGLFTNNDARPKINHDTAGNRDHIDYNGMSIFLAWVQPNSQIGAGFIVQDGRGEAQKISGSKTVQTVEASALTFAFSATHSF